MARSCMYGKMEGPLGNELDLAVHMQLWQRGDITGAARQPPAASIAQSLYVQQWVQQRCK